MNILIENDADTTIANNIIATSSFTASGNTGSAIRILNSTGLLIKNYFDGWQFLMGAPVPELGLPVRLYKSI